LRSRALLLSLCLFPVLAVGDSPPLVLLFEEAGERRVTIAKNPLEEPPEDAEAFREVEAKIDRISKHHPEEWVFVWDLRSNRVAARQLKDTGFRWAVKNDQFDRVGALRVRVEHQGRPVAAAQVVLKDEKREMSKILDPNMNGEVRFFDVVPGDVTVTVEHAGGRTRQIFEVSLEESDAERPLVVPVTEEVATVGSAAPGAGSSPAAGGSPSPVGSLLAYLLGLVAVVGAGYAAVLLFKRHPKVIEEHLAKLGVDIPKPGTGADPGSSGPGSSGFDPSGPDPAPMLQKPAPQQKILLPDASPSAGVGLAATGVPGAASSQGVGMVPPRLSGPMGLVELAEGATVVGRDAAAGLPLPDEPSVSRRHAEVEWSEGEVKVTDLGSTNGTFVNDRPIDAPTVLSPGDRVRFGAVEFRFEP
jgi:hypothetical protein